MTQYDFNSSVLLVYAVGGKQIPPVSQWDEHTALIAYFINSSDAGLVKLALI